MGDKAPIIDLYTLCWNEEKIIPFFLYYYDKFVRKIIVYDNESTDRSVEILKQHPKVEVIPYSTNGQIRDDIYLKIKNNVWKSDKSPDFTIVCDMDEFLYHPQLEEKLISFNKSPATLLKPTGYDMVIESFDFIQNGNLPELVNTGYRNKNFDKMMIFKPKEIKEINYTYGGHNARPSGNIVYYENEGFKLLHYKRLGWDYFANKMLVYQKRMSEFNKAKRLGFEYLKNREQHRVDFDHALAKSAKVI